MILKALKFGIKSTQRLFEMSCLIFIMKFWNVKIDVNSIKKIYGIPYIRNHGALIIKDIKVINSKYSSNPIGGQGFCSFVVKKGASIEIEKGAAISNSSFFSSKKIFIGKNVYIGGDCKIYDTDFHSVNYSERVIENNIGAKVASVIIEEGAFIGTGTIILKGVRIGKHSVVGAGSIVTKDIPDGEMWAGNPCRFIKRI